MVVASLFVLDELFKFAKNLIDNFEDELDQLLSRFIMNFNRHLEEVKIMLQLCNFYNEGMYTNGNLLQLSSRNLINLVPLRKDSRKLDGYFNEFNLSSQVIIAVTKPLFMKIHHQNELPIWRIKQIAQPINPNILSLSTVLISPNWYHQITLKVEELTLNITTKNYLLPEFIKQMGQLKVLRITNDSDYPSKLHNLSLIQCLSNLKKMRSEHVSVSSFQPVLPLKNLKELSFVMCEINDSLTSSSYPTESPPYMLPSLTNLELDMCYDLKEIPSEFCNLVNLQKLSITNCHELDVPPKDLVGGLSNLEILNLHCCTKLQELPESIGSARNLSFIDISDCLSVSVLPEEIGELCGLRVLKINGCGGLQELPLSMSGLSKLEEVICDEETSYLLMEFESDLHNLKVNVVEDDRLGSFMKIVQ